MLLNRVKPFFLAINVDYFHAGWKLEEIIRQRGLEEWPGQVKVSAGRRVLRGPHRLVWEYPLLGVITEIVITCQFDYYEL